MVDNRDKSTHIEKNKGKKQHISAAGTNSRLEGKTWSGGKLKTQNIDNK